jgi:hypothetical protein
LNHIKSFLAVRNLREACRATRKELLPFSADDNDIALTAPSASSNPDDNEMETIIGIHLNDKEGKFYYLVEWANHTWEKNTW